MKNTSIWGFLVVLVVGLLGVAYWKYDQEQAQQQATATEIKGVAPAALPEESSIKYPIAPPAEPPQAPPSAEPATGGKTPEAKGSDNAMRDLLIGLFGEKNGDIWILDHFAERFVLLVDSLPRRGLAIHRLPIQPAAGTFIIDGDEKDAVLSEENYRRYAVYVALLQGADAGRLATVYRRHYPRFQEAYQNLGYPDGYFNDRLMEVIDHMLAAPEATAPVRLERFAARYRFVDPELEALSAGEKVLLRMGPENALRIKEKLREIRRELVRQSQREG
jgi:hypothetical protein